ncbi:MAG: DUF4844 domain-containing protein [Phenylobacterium sp.]|uniref:DUF4844 domain-containing protein n=1 Tax=Phenylobacterium sp. TaxID=1871053 RepID=UPI00391DA4E3
MTPPFCGSFEPRFNVWTSATRRTGRARRPYFEEIMECIGLESSEGLLNEFVYGFDPSDLTL